MKLTKIAIPVFLSIILVTSNITFAYAHYDYPGDPIAVLVDAKTVKLNQNMNDGVIDSLGDAELILTLTFFSPTHGFETFIETIEDFDSSNGNIWEINERTFFDRECTPFSSLLVTPLLIEVDEFGTLESIGIVIISETTAAAAGLLAGIAASGGTGAAAGSSGGPIGAGVGLVAGLIIGSIVAVVSTTQDNVIMFGNDFLIDKEGPTVPSPVKLHDITKTNSAELTLNTSIEPTTHLNANTACSPTDPWSGLAKPGWESYLDKFEKAKDALKQIQELKSQVSQNQLVPLDKHASKMIVNSADFMVASILSDSSNMPEYSEAIFILNEARTLNAEGDFLAAIDAYSLTTQMLTENPSGELVDAQPHLFASAITTNPVITSNSNNELLFGVFSNSEHSVELIGMPEIEYVMNSDSLPTENGLMTFYSVDFDEEFEIDSGNYSAEVVIVGELKEEKIPLVLSVSKSENKIDSDENTVNQSDDEQIHESVIIAKEYSVILSVNNPNLLIEEKLSLARGEPIILTVTDPVGKNSTKAVSVSGENLSHKLSFDKNLPGKYKVIVEYDDNVLQIIDVDVKTKLVPEWIKNNAKWWSDGSIDDESFISGIQFLIKEKILGVTTLPDQASEVTEHKVPDWIKNNAGWWADGLISEDDFIKGIKYLVEKGIIQVN